MAMTRTATVAAPISIIGKDLDAGATFNADTTPAQGVLKAGTLMKYTVGTQVLAKAVVGTDTVAGILADDVDTGAAGATEIIPIMVYRRGVFRRQEVESANNAAITPGSAVDIALNDLGIFLELSYDGYEGLSPVPAGVQPMPMLVPPPEGGNGGEGLEKPEEPQPPLGGEARRQEPPR
jgi:hypothetical protein